jgi:hypothetical protein
MQQRRLRPGDVLDDYCPRERRITDHAIVAMIDDAIKQTRCVSCDTEHEYKQARLPPQRRKKGASGLFGQVLEGLQPPTARPVGPSEPDELPVVERPAVAQTAPEMDEVELDGPHGDDAAPSPAADDRVVAPPAARPDVEDGAVRRPLIRAQLPRPEGQPAPTRTLPEFTARLSKNARTTRSGAAHRHGGGRRRADALGSGGVSRFGGHRKPGGPGGRSDRGHQPSGWTGNRADRGVRGGRRGGGKKR